MERATLETSSIGDIVTDGNGQFAMVLDLGEGKYYGWLDEEDAARFGPARGKPIRTVSDFDD